MRVPILGALCGLLVSLVSAESKFIPTRPPSIPLAVKNPYLSTWFPAGSDHGNGGYLPGQWPSFYTGQTIGWTGLIRVDGKTFTWMGAPGGIDLANQTMFEYTSTKSIFTIEVDNKITMKITFLSPLTPTDLKRQSLPFSYLYVDISSSDGSSHDVQLYSDISAEWAGGDYGAVVQWDTATDNDISYHRIGRQDQKPFNEFYDRAEWGQIYYATDAKKGLTSQSGSDIDVRGTFVSAGMLDNSQDDRFRAIYDDWPVFGHAVNLGAVEKAVSTLFSIGLCQHEAIQFLGTDGVVVLPSLWLSYFKEDLDALSFFHKDFFTAFDLSTQLDTKISVDSDNAAGSDYKILTSLAARQTFGATQLVGTEDKKYLFLKEISSNGNTQTIDVIYPASPIFLYLNPELVKLLLDPHFENQESGHYPNKWAMHDLGTHYPNATGHPDGYDEPMPLEECGNNLIMVLAYVQRSKNAEYIIDHYPILKQWAEYLVEDSLYPAWQLSTDDFAGQLENQTNLALKGIIGLEAMSQIAKIAGEDADAQNYTTIAHAYIEKWQELGFNTTAKPLPHASITYNNLSTHGLLYNLYNDKLLGTNIVPDDVYQQQSAFYLSVQEKYGVPLDTRNRYYTKSDWEIFCAAVASQETRDMFIQRIAKWVGETSTGLPFTDLYETDSGHHPFGIEFKARPVIGAMFALLLV